MPIHQTHKYPLTGKRSVFLGSFIAEKLIVKKSTLVYKLRLFTDEILKVYFEKVKNTFNSL